MAFRIQRTQRSLPDRAGGYQTDINLSTGKGAIAQGIAALGGGLMGLGESLHRLEAENQFSEAKRQLGETLNTLWEDFERDPDSSTYQERFKIAMASAKDFTPKNALAARGFSQLLAQTQVEGQNQVNEARLARERDTFYANRIGEIASGQFIAAKVQILKGIPKGFISPTTGQMLLNQIGKEEQEAVEKQAELKERAEMELITNWALMKPTLDEALDLVRSKGFEKGWTNANTTFVEGLVRDEFTRQEAREKEDEQNRIDAAYADFSRRLYDPAAYLRTKEVYDAKLPRVETDLLISAIRLRDKQLKEEAFLSTSALSRAAFNNLLREVLTGKKTSVVAMKDYLGMADNINSTEHAADVDKLFKAEQDSKDPSVRRMQTLLAGREKTIRDAIEADVSFFADQTDRDYMKNLANEAVNEFNDVFAGMSVEDFTEQKMKDTADALIQKYAISRQALLQAKHAKSLIEQDTFPKQVQAFQALLRGMRLSGNTLGVKAMIDEGIKLGLVNPDGTLPDIGTLEPKSKSDLQGILERLVK